MSQPMFIVDSDRSSIFSPGCRTAMVRSRGGKVAEPFANLEPPKLSRAIDFTEQFSKHDSSIRISRESLSNVIDSSALRIPPAKHRFPMIWTFRGMQIDFNEHLSKHDSSIRISRESLSNVMDSISEEAKHHSQRISMLSQIYAPTDHPKHQTSES
jgi:hypothetical protein